MGLLDQIQPKVKTAEDGVTDIKRIIQNMVGNIQFALTQVRKVYQVYGTDEIDAALGEDLAQLDVIYAAMKTVLASEEIGKDIPDIAKQK